MTVAICLACGESKFGAFVGCKVCSFRPSTGWELAISQVCSDNVMPVSVLKQIAVDIDEDRLARQPHSWNFDEGADIYISRTFDDPTWRDMFSLTKLAKQSFFSKQMNWHFNGTDGYRCQVVTRGQEITKGEFDALKRENGEDVFFVEAHFSGKPNATQIDKAVWYCMADLNEYVERQVTSKSLEVAVLNEQGEHFTRNYLKRKHGVAI